MADGPLDGLVVLDLTIARAGPTAVRLLADWGADVIKIEPPPVGGGSITGGRRGPDEQNLHRNKRGLCIDLKNADGHATFMKLAERADIVVENFRADVKHRLKVDYDSVKAVNPNIIYASISGFGQEGPYSERPGVDQIVQGMSGLMSITGEPGQGPMRVGIAISDTTAGMFLGQGILLALLHREKTGEGQWVHTSLLEGMLNKLDFQGARYTMNGDVPGQQGNDHPTSTPMGAFPCRDGWVNIAAPTDRMWRRFCEGAGAEYLLTDERFDSVGKRIKAKTEVKAAITDAIKEIPVVELVERLNKEGVPCGPINDVQGGYDNEQAQYLKMARPAPHKEMGDVSLIRSPINLSAYPHPERFDCAAPDPGQDSADVLSGFGFSDAEIGALKNAGAINT